MRQLMSRAATEGEGERVDATDDIFFLGAHFLSIEGRGPFRPIAVNKRGYQGRWQGRVRARRETSEGGRVDEGGIAGSGSEVNAISTYETGGERRARTCF